MENNIEEYSADSISGNSDEVVKLHQEKLIETNPYPNGRARAFIEQMLKNKREHQEAFTREYKNNPDLRKKFEELAKRNKP